MEPTKTFARPAGEAVSLSAFQETHVIIQNGADAQLRVTLNNDTRGVVEVEFHELYEAPFRYPFAVVD